MIWVLLFEAAILATLSYVVALIGWKEIRYYMNNRRKL
ncbi:putative membrane protein [Ochrobactrum quorumnocens]|uniref:Putative membrane protein n=1 Tax=Ochrobactrum quorumnocens TaxID=271865 RepID=A0A248UAH6_9HYPH|nr:putative membrane protein [[Ochrobactrum] quorumnocens]ASV85367.1 putative membrane protein [[Ochrobactrum] quorumnocens]